MSQILTTLDDVLYYPILVIVLLVAGIYFTYRTRFIQGRWLTECIRVVMEKPEKKGPFLLSRH